jgi:hypothetical protein
MKEGEGLQIISSEKVRMKSGEEIGVGGVYSSTARDEVYYLKSDNSNGSVLVDMPTRLTIRKINFISAGNQNNSVSVTTEINSTDQCVGNVLIENSCVRGINTGYLCAKGCNQGACIR